MKKSFISSLTIAVMFAFLIFSGSAFAAHPLITDDTGTQGKGKFQLEINGQYDHDTNEGVTTNTTEIVAAFSYGLIDNVDLVLGLPYQFIKTRDAASSFREDGISDASLELKWRFYEKDGLGFALKPGVTLPTGDDERGLGAGRATYSLFFITTKELKPWAFHVNLAYIRNENKEDARTDVFHASLASELEVAENLKAVVNVGIERNPDRASNTHPAFILGGLIYSISDHVDIDFGVKGGLNIAEPDYSILAGIALKF